MFFGVFFKVASAVSFLSLLVLPEWTVYHQWPQQEPAAGSGRWAAWALGLTAVDPQVPTFGLGGQGALCRPAVAPGLGPPKLHSAPAARSHGVARTEVQLKVESTVGSVDFPQPLPGQGDARTLPAHIYSKEPDREATYRRWLPPFLASCGPRC